jgi:thioredoxin 1
MPVLQQRHGPCPWYLFVPKTGFLNLTPVLLRKLRVTILKTEQRFDRRFTKMAEGKALTLTKENFDQVLNGTDKLVVVDFWAAWCGPCRAVAPIIEELAQEYEGKAVIGKVNVDEQNEISYRYRIMSIPTLIFFKGGQVVDKIVGARTKSELAELIDKNL